MTSMLDPSRTIVIAGCGPSVNNTPDALWRRFKVFGVNLMPVHLSVKLAYWTAWDAWSLPVALDHPSVLEADIFLNERQFGQPNMVGHGDLPIVWYKAPFISGIKYSDATGAIFATSLHAAVWISIEMLPYETLILTGFDCRKGMLHDNNHFYRKDVVPDTYEPTWDHEMGLLHKLAESRGKLLVNVSKPTSARTLPVWNAEELL